MPRVTRRPSNSVNDRPTALRMLLRRGWRKLRPAGWLGLGIVLLLGGAVALHTLSSGGSPGGSSATPPPHSGCGSTTS
jgi:hypothetical protein